MTEKEWFEARIRYEKTLESGEKKKVTEAYLVNAVSVSEAEKKVIGSLSPYIAGEFAVRSVKAASFDEIIRGDGGKFYSAKLKSVVIDDITGKEKKVGYSVLVQADAFTEAHTQVKGILCGELSDYDIGSITENPILEIIP